MGEYVSCDFIFVRQLLTKPLYMHNLYISMIV